MRKGKEKKERKRKKMRPFLKTTREHHSPFLPTKHNNSRTLNRQRLNTKLNTTIRTKKIPRISWNRSKMLAKRTRSCTKT